VSSGHCGSLARLSILGAAWGCIAVSSALAAQPGHVLALYSNHRLLPANVEVDRGLRDTFAESPGRGVEVFAEFLDQPTFSGPAVEGTIATYLREKYATRPPGVIVVGGQGALDFVLRHRADVFPHAPVVHLAIDQSTLQAMPAMPADVVGIPVVYDYVGTIAQALRLHPRARHVVVVTGTSSVDRDWEAKARADLPSGGFRDIEYLAGLPTDALLTRLRKLGETHVVFTPGFFTDGAGRSSTPRESVTLMAAASGAPVYGPYSTFIGTGVVGGLMPTYVEMGRQAARTVNALLDGTAPEDLKLAASIPPALQIDWRQARKWNIRADDVPADAVVHFREPTFWETYRNTAIAILAVFVLQAVLIGALLVERRLRRRTAAALKESEKRMNLAAHAARLSMWALDVSRDKLWTTARIGGSPGPAAEGTTDFAQILATVHPQDRERVDAAVRQAVTADIELDVEFLVQQPRGAVRWIAVRGRADQRGGPRLTGVALDITARKEAELQAQSDRAALTHITRASMLGQLSASIAHQLNQPLAAILGNAETARKMLDQKPLDVTELKDICDDIVTEDRRAAEVIRRLSALYRRGEMKLAPLDLNELVNETLDLVRTELTSRHVVAVTELATALPAVEAGRIQLQQVLLNLVLNAADAMTDLDAAARTLVIRTELEGASARLCVADHGTGISTDNLKQVFEPFWSTKVNGFGMGLAICQSIVKAHHGSLTAINNPEGGATFCVKLPFERATEAAGTHD
jgi:C4-dicarboxylate-specific signal transduction histidine kinase